VVFARWDVGGAAVRAPWFSPHPPIQAAKTKMEKT
jgi:hypothetical protein